MEMKRILVFLCLCIPALLTGQLQPGNARIRILQVADTVRVDTLSLNPNYFKVYDALGNEVDPKKYQVDYARSLLIPEAASFLAGEEIRIVYQPLPEFLTRNYAAFDPALVVERATDESRLYKAQSRSQKGISKPFEGLHTSGSLSRAVTIGNNQDAVVHSNFNLQIEGMLSEKVGIRASITDNEIPLQEGGFTQRLDEFDKVFLQLFSDNWTLTAGDVDLFNTASELMRFQKKISGVSVSGKIGHDKGQTEFFASGALVKGKFHSHRFTGLDGNQGPYKILGPDNEQFVLMISGSERVYANGVLLRRGEDFDYTIDYNTAEITFTTLYPVTANLRLTVEYQIAERNYVRFLTYDGVGYSSDKFSMGVKYYNETDSKNNPQDQDLTEEQKQILSEAGNDPSKMVAPSEVPAVYEENRILYRKELRDGQDVYVFSNDPNEELYQVSFSYVGEFNGDYVIGTSLAAGRVYVYTEEVNGEKQGAYMPLVQLVAPEKLQMMTLDAVYRPGTRTDLRAELALSDRDRNLFSDRDDGENTGYAAKMGWSQKVLDREWKLDGKLDYEYLSRNFNTIERIRNVEFSRDWNLDGIDLNENREQQFVRGGLHLEKDSVLRLDYLYENLRLAEDYRGDRHNLAGKMAWRDTRVFLDASALQNEDAAEENQFIRLYSGIVQRFSRFWVGMRYNFEENLRQDATSGSLRNSSHRFSDVQGFTGVGDSTKVYLEIGYQFRVTDSVQQTDLDRVNRSNAVYLKSRMLQSETADLYVFANYRKVDNERIPDEESLNARLSYRQRILGNFISLQSLYDTRTGNLPQQEFTYLEVEPGKGFYEWIDFNSNGIQELDEFVVAQFPDQAIFVRVLLPTVQFIRTNQNKWSQTLQLDGSGWKNREGWKGILSHFSNQTYFLIDSRTRQSGKGFQLNPFSWDEEDLLGLDQNLKNSLFYNRGLQKYSTVYTYLQSRKKTIYTFGDQDIEWRTHQLQFSHKFGEYWLLDLEGGTGTGKSSSVTYSNRNYELKQWHSGPRLSYLHDKNTRLEVFYSFKDKQNRIGAQETLQSHLFGSTFQYANRQRFSVNANVNLYFNAFEGNSGSPVAYQMLEGLQPGTNFTWLLSAQKRLTSFLDLNLNYTGRKSEETKTIHTGTMQIRATF